MSRTSLLAAAGFRRQLSPPSNQAETFTSVNGSAWPSPWITTAATADIQDNAGRLVTHSGGFDQAFARRVGPGNGELTFRWKWLSAGSDRSFTAVVRGGNNFGDNPKYEIRANPDSLWLRRSGTLLDQDTSRAFSVGTWYWFRVRWDGTLVQARSWADGDSEPSVWHVEAIDGSGPSSGNVLLRIENGNDSSADSLLIDDLTITEVNGGGSSGNGFGVDPFGTSPFGGVVPSGASPFGTAPFGTSPFGGS